MNDSASPEASTKLFLADVVEGLNRPDKQIPCKYFYDARGSELFEQICTLEAYYPTRTELGIMQAAVVRMARAMGPRLRLVEFGAGSGKKTEMLLGALTDPVAYVPVEISAAALSGCAARLSKAFPALELLPVQADYTSEVDLPEPRRPYEATAVYYPGSTIGNFEPEDATSFMKRIAGLVGQGGGLLIGVDLQKDRQVLERAYNDAEGVTAAFNLNLLERINRELGADFDLEAFRHRAVWNAQKGRIEMHLVSTRPQTVTLEGREFAFAQDEFITTEYSYKYEPDAFEALAVRAGLEPRQMWSDDKGWFAVWYLEV